MSSSNAPVAKKKSELPHAVIRFKHAIVFPRFSVLQGERWAFVATGSNAERLRLIKAGGRFDFAGGHCLANDVELIYEGPCNIAYSIAKGDITDAGFIAQYRANPALYEAMRARRGGAK
jgi:hypothetical protein